MWSQLRSAVEDVKEFGTGAISEVSQGVHQGRRIAAQTAAQAPQLAKAAASIVEGRRNRHHLDEGRSTDSGHGNGSGHSDLTDGLAAVTSVTQQAHRPPTSVVPSDDVQIDDSGRRMRSAASSLNAESWSRVPSSMENTLITDDDPKFSAAEPVEGTVPRLMQQEGTQLASSYPGPAPTHVHIGSSTSGRGTAPADASPPSTTALETEEH